MGRLQAALAVALARPLLQYEADLVTHPRLCGVCLAGDQAALANCPACQGAAWCRAGTCREEDRALHATACPAIRDALRDEAWGQRLGHTLACYMPVPQTCPAPLPRTLPALLQEGAARLLPEAADPEHVASELRRLSLAYTCPATTLWGAELAGLELAGRAALTLHVVGARRAEVEQAGAWAGLLAARLPCLRAATLVLVGPEVGRGELPAGFSLTVGRLEATFRLEQSGYREYARSKVKCIRPLENQLSSVPSSVRQIHLPLFGHIERG
jgi:hypothetical protein